MRPGLDFKSKLLGKRLDSHRVVPSEAKEAVKFKLNVLVESDVLVNFLFDYSQDSSKIDVAKECNERALFKSIKNSN